MARSFMSGPRYEPDDPREWLSRARSNLRLASVEDPSVHLEELCYNAHQAAVLGTLALLTSALSGRERPHGRLSLHQLLKLPAALDGLRNVMLCNGSQPILLDQR